MWTTVITVIFVFMSHSKQHVNLSIQVKKIKKQNMKKDVWEEFFGLGYSQN